MPLGRVRPDPCSRQPMSKGPVRTTRPSGNTRSNATDGAPGIVKSVLCETTTTRSSGSMWTDPARRKDQSAAGGALRPSFRRILSKMPGSGGGASIERAANASARSFGVGLLPPSSNGSEENRPAYFERTSYSGESSLRQAVTTTNVRIPRSRRPQSRLRVMPSDSNAAGPVSRGDTPRSPSRAERSPGPTDRRTTSTPRSSPSHARR